MNRYLSSLALSLCLSASAFAQNAPLSPYKDANAHLDPNIPDMARPMAARDVVFIEDMTWMEVRDALAAGKTTAIIATGGVEMNGPYITLGKHNVILRATTERIARKLGNALVAPIIAYVPEGDITERTGHVRFPGTLSLRQGTFVSLLTDAAESLKAGGFKTIVLIGDSGGNQAGLRMVAESLAGAWAETDTRIFYIPEYYDNPRWNAWLAENGVKETAEGYHDDFRHSAIMAYVDPHSVRAEERMAVGNFSINGVSLAPLEKTRAIADKLIDYQAEVTVAALKKAMGQP